MNHSDNYLEHYGILGMKWGVRRYQYKDGTLTPAGRRRYAGDRVIASGDRYEITVPRRTKLTEDDMRHLVSFIDMNRRLDDLSTDSSARERREAKRDQHEAQKRADQQQRHKERREDRQRREDRRQQKNNPAKNQPDVKKGKDSVDAIINRAGSLIKVGISALTLYKGYQEFKKIRSENDDARQAVNDAQRTAREAAREAQQTAREAAREAARVAYDNNDITRYATLALPSGSKRRRRQ